MLKITVRLLVGVFVCGFAFCNITCPDGNICPDNSTCCKSYSGYGCCLYPKAVCCPDKEHCCPSGYRCNSITHMCEKLNQPWMNVPLVKKEAAEKPSASVVPVSPLQEKKSSVVHCDNYYACPDGTTCCRHPTGAWFCCLYSPGRCCLDGYHCCPYGYDCNLSYTQCVRQGLKYPFTPNQALSSVPASFISTPEDKDNLQETPMTALTEANDGALEAGVIRCDSKFFCPAGKTCCKGAKSQWSCCPYPLGQCCADGLHCCEYGYTCDPSSMQCRKWYSQIPSGTQEDAKTD